MEKQYLGCGNWMKNVRIVTTPSEHKNRGISIIELGGRRKLVIGYLCQRREHVLLFTQTSLVLSVRGKP